MKTDFKGFADEMIAAAWEAYDLDGAQIQEMAENHGLLVQKTMTEPCCDDCMCAEVSDFPTTCYRKTYD